MIECKHKFQAVESVPLKPKRRQVCLDCGKTMATWSGPVVVPADRGLTKGEIHRQPRSRRGRGQSALP